MKTATHRDLNPELAKPERCLEVTEWVKGRRNTTQMKLKQVKPLT